MQTFLHADWRSLTTAQRQALIQSLPPVSALPGANFITSLYKYRAATIELLENREESAVYRHRQTGIIRLERADGKGEYFDSDRRWQLAEKSDEIITAFHQKPLVYVLRPGRTLTRLKMPEFSGTYSADGKSIDVLYWLHSASEQQKAAAVKKGLMFIASYL